MKSHPMPSAPPAWGQGEKHPVSCGGECVKTLGSEGWFCQGWSAEFIDCDCTGSIS